MKRIKLLSLLTLPICSLPIALAATSCSAINTKSLTLNNADVDKNITSLKKDSPSMKKLMWGDKSYNDGNYVLFICHSGDEGNSGNIAWNNFFFGNRSAFDKDNIKDTKFSNNINDYLLNQTYLNPMGDSVSVKFVLYMEYNTKETWNDGDGANSKAKTGACSPFATYGEQDDKVKSDDKKKGDFVRNDKAAKQYRNLISVSKKLIGDDKVDNDFTAIQWVKGHPKGFFKSDALKEDDSFARAISENIKNSDIKWWIK